MNPSRGQLLKPGQQGNGTSKLTTTKPSRAVSGRSKSRYDECKEMIHAFWWVDRLRVGEILKEIRDEKLYVGEHETFEEFCLAAFDLKRSKVYRLIDLAEVKALPEQTSQEWDKASSDTLGSVVVDASVEVVDVKAPSEPVAPAPKVINLDKTNYPIPEEIYPDWIRAEAFAEHLRSVSQIKSLIAKGLEDGDIIFRELNNDTVSTLKNIYGEMKCVIPYAVCSSCQGRSPKRCALCKGRGFLSRFAWDQFVPAKTKEMRERMSA